MLESNGRETRGPNRSSFEASGPWFLACVGAMVGLGMKDGSGLIGSYTVEGHVVKFHDVDNEVLGFSILPAAPVRLPLVYLRTGQAIDSTWATRLERCKPG